MSITKSGIGKNIKLLQKKGAPLPPLCKNTQGRPLSVSLFVSELEQ